ncbi:MAG: aspartate carbamoyltransferase [Candidatus Gracilibacteria bacterium]|nr:aspartate carbamoyltransferase [Candidatus Gracilibacteria bacterium]
MRHIISSKQFSRADIDYLMSEARKMDTILSKGGSRMFDEKIMATLFYEPSTRTRLSFESAMHRLGGKVISETDVTFSSQSKGEILADTIRIVSGYADIIAIRSKNTGDALLASQYSSVPIINAGDGSGEHPTQSLLDLYTITKSFPQIFEDKPMQVTFVGDLRYGRTVHSLSLLLRNFANVSIAFIAPENLNIPEEYKKEEDFVSETLSDELLSKSDVIYMTRVQKERFPNLESYEAVKDAFIFDEDTVGKMKSDAILMHPLPRVNEITLGVDNLPQARYFEQARNGVPMRMALIKYCLEH